MTQLALHPVQEFLSWYEEAKQTPLRDPHAMALATVTAAGLPQVRMVLMKHFDEEGLVFYTHHTSPKSREIRASGHASACFFWETTRKQVRVTGPVEAVRASEADAYFASRPRESQLGAWASLQSQPLSERAVFEERVKELEGLFAGQPVPRPEHWSGWRIKPETMEFWIEKPFRLHERYIYQREADGWKKTLLYP